jgi:Tol biopolymer transport system component
VIGETLGPYRILDKLGEGGMGVVYRARDPRLARDVAIKVLPESFAGDSQRLRRFVQEARGAGQLNHPNILAVYDVGTHAGAPYLVSELLEGESLRSQLIRGPLPPRKATEYARQIAEGLAAAHDKGIVHRDLKPDNLFITSDGRLKILDFGIAKLTPGDEDGERETILPTETEPGMIVGTAGYMSPEQVRGESVDGRSDLFNVGIVLFEMLTNRPAFRRTTAGETMAAILKDDPLAEMGTTGWPALVRIIARCLEKNRGARFQSARDLAFALDVLSNTGETAPPVERGTSRRRRGIAIGVAVAVLALVAAAAWLARVNQPRPLDVLLTNAVLTPLTNFEGSEEDAAISPDGKFIVFGSDRNGPFHVWRHQIGSGRFDDITIGLPDQRNPGNLPAAGFSGDGSEIWLAGGRNARLRLLPLLGGPQRVFLHEQAVNATWSPDGKQVVYFTWAAGDPLTITDATGGNPRELWIDPKGEHNHFPAWSPDGRWIYFANGSQASTEYDVWRIPSAGGQPERLTNLNTYVRYLTPIDDRTVLYVAPDEDLSGPWLWALDVDTKTTHRVSAGLERYLSISADATGRRLVASVANPTAGLWSVPILDRVAEERDVKPYSLPAGRALAPRFGKNAMFYLSSSGARDGLWRLADDKPIEIWKGLDGALSSPASVSPQGDLVAVSPSRQGKRRLTVISSDGAGYRSLTDAVDVRGVSSWSPDSKWIVTSGKDAQGLGLFLIPVDGGPPRRILAGPAFDPVWSPTDDLIVYTGHQRAGAPLVAVRSDGSPVKFPEVPVPFGGGGRARFVPGGNAIIYIAGAIGEQNFWRLDLATLKTRQLTNFSNPATMFAFDITPDGTAIVFDRLRENSDLRLIERRR